MIPFAVKVLIGLVIFLIILVPMFIKVVKEYERLIVFRLGKVLKAPKGPGLVFLIPFVDKTTRVSIQIITLDIEPQDIITRDNISLKVNAVVYYRIINPVNAIVNIQNFRYATSQLAQTHLRSVLGEHTLDDLLTERDKINDKIQTILDQNTDPWGIKVAGVEIKHVDLPPDMQRAMAKEAEAERERRSKIIAAEGELQASAKLTEAANMMSSNPMTLQLRYLQTLTDIAIEHNSTIVFPLPLELTEVFNKNK